MGDSRRRPPPWVYGSREGLTVVRQALPLLGLRYGLVKLAGAQHEPVPLGTPGYVTMTLYVPLARAAGTVTWNELFDAGATGTVPFAAGSNGSQVGAKITVSTSFKKLPLIVSRLPPGT